MEDSTNLVTVESKLKTIDNITTNDYGTVALNVYQIYPNTIVYTIAGYTDVSSSSTGDLPVIGSSNTSIFLTNFNIGILYPRNFNIYTTDVSARKVDIEYVDSSGNYNFSGGIQITNNTGTVYNLNAININRISWTDVSTNYSIPFSTVLIARDTDNTLFYRNSIDTSFGSGSSIITIPNSYIGILSDVYVRILDEVGSFFMIIKDKRNNIKVAQVYKIGPEGTPLGDGRAGKYVSVDVKYPLYPGDSVFFVSRPIASITARVVHAIVTLTRF